MVVMEFLEKTSQQISDGALEKFLMEAMGRTYKNISGGINRRVSYTFFEEIIERNF